MKLDALGHPPISTYQDILEEEQAMANYVVDVLPRYCCIMEIGKVGIDKELFSDDSEVRDVLPAMICIVVHEAA